MFLAARVLKELYHAVSKSVCEREAINDRALVLFVAARCSTMQSECVRERGSRSQSTELGL